MLMTNLHALCARLTCVRRLCTTARQAKYLAKHTKKTEEQIMADFERPRYFNPYEAVGYGLIDKVGSII